MSWIRLASLLTIALILVTAVVMVGLGSAESASGRRFTNPVYPHNFADPFILRVGKTYYAYGTGTCNRNLQVMHSTDLVHWSSAGEALKAVPTWSGNTCVSFFQNRMVWAPEVLHRADGKYNLYYTAHWTAKNTQCVSRATSSSPRGPFVDSSNSPLVCQLDKGGSIDPDVFRDAKGHLYLLWKNDGNCCGLTTYIWVQRLNKQGTALTGTRSSLEKNDAAWEGNLVEAPTMWRHGTSYYLFYSANAFNTSAYGVGYAACRGPFGPCRDARENPILKSRCNAIGPGHQSLIVDRKGQTWIVYHAWRPTDVGDRPGGPGRLVWLDRVTWNGGKPTVHGPTCSVQPAPA